MTSNTFKPTATLQDELNRCMPIARSVGLGDLLFGLVQNQNAIIEQLAAAGITGITADTLPTPLTLPGFDPQ
ncbi:hypothetical protein NO263_03445 [Gluconacetobacter entanii]|uniref:Uncharacterized protein n=2 Tax=Acetobacteraceae TaxID=433 RepID=A0ABQ0SFR0_NOVHA|nr:MULTISPECIES: hypothetical protein [Acetobacteraceae]MCW4589630.1 hypothetical protein [Gluconacetobacter entanii]MCW4592918.1 hypothetical protein [Gluconacetobacter entanii]NPC89164.1 hypothetical protein [Gluconacetobacter entanii]GAN83809.1 hypothetical protein Gaha_0105_044 [Novacetimonas hansenii JCM 7643]GBQ63163.1 hypothetical protein AA0243_3037 [Novacetimonas hansenii NRIC 0243]